jgi:hypothetical protein
MRVRSALEVAAEKYVVDHFEAGVVTVFPPKVPGAEGETPEEIFIIQIVSNKYNPSNFWWVIQNLIPWPV